MTSRVPEPIQHQEDAVASTTSAASPVTPPLPPVAPADTMHVPPSQPESPPSQEDVSPTGTEEAVADVQPVMANDVDTVASTPTSSVETALAAPLELRVGQITPGDTALELFIRAGVDTAQVMTLQRAIRSIYDIRQLHVGHAYRIERTTDGQLQRFTYDIDAEHRLAVERRGETFVGRVEPIRYKQHQRLVSSRVVGSLYVTLTRQGESPRLVHDVAHIFAGKLNFLTDLQRDNALCLLLEERSRVGQGARYERLLAVVLLNGEQLLQAVYYAQSQTEGYYQPDGQPLQGAPLSKPELQTFLAHSAPLLAQLTQCQAASQERRADLR